jgi:hypothetical protein
MSNVKGSAISARVRFVRERFGDAGYQRLLASLTSAERALIEGRILPHAWVPYDLFVDLNVAVDRCFGRGDLALCFEMGRYSAEVNLPTLYRLFYRFGTPMFVFRKAAQLWSVHYDSGEIVPVDEGGNSVRIKIERFARPHRAHCQSVLGWAAKSIEMSGGRVRRADEERCRTRDDAACELALRWD